MDFHEMKRKELQSLCKKHGIPANLTNHEMADRLDLILKHKDEKPLTQGQSCNEVIDVEADSNIAMAQKGKKVRFSPENQIIRYVLSESESGSDKDFTSNKKRVVKRKSMAKRMTTKNKVQVTETDKEAERPIRITRSKLQTTVGGGNEKMGSSLSPKKRSARGGIEKGVSSKLSRVADIDDNIAEYGVQAESKVGLFTRQLRNRKVVAEVGFPTKDKATTALSRDMGKTIITSRTTRSNTIVDKKDSSITIESEVFEVGEKSGKVQLEEPWKCSREVSLVQKPATFQKGRIQNEYKAEQCVEGDQVSRKISRKQSKKTAEATIAVRRELGKTNINRRMTRSNTIVDKKDSSITRESEVFEVEKKCEKVQLEEPSKGSSEISLGQKPATFQKGRVKNEYEAEQCVEGDQVSRKYSRKQSKKTAEDRVSGNVVSAVSRAESEIILPSGLSRRSRRKTTLLISHNAAENANSFAIGPSRRSQRNTTLFNSVATASDEEVRTEGMVGRFRQPKEAALERCAKVAKPIRRSNHNTMRQISEERSFTACEPVNNKPVKCFSCNVSQNEVVDCTELGNSSAKGNKQHKSKIQNLVVKESNATNSLSHEELPAEEFNPTGSNGTTSAFHIHPPSSSPQAQGDGELDEAEKLHITSEVDFESKHSEKDEEIGKDRTMFKQSDQHVSKKQHEEIHDDYRVYENDVSSLNGIDCLVSDQPVCANESEIIANHTAEAVLSSELSADLPLVSNEQKKGDGERDEAEKLHVSSEIDSESKHSEKYEEIDKDRTMFEQSDQQVYEKQHNVAEEVHDDDRVFEEDVSSLNDIDCLVSDQSVCANESETLAKQTQEVADPKKGGGEWDEAEELHIFSKVDLGSKHSEKDEEKEKDLTKFEQSDQLVFQKQLGEHQHIFDPPVSNEDQFMHEFIKVMGSFAPMHEEAITDSAKLNGYDYEAMQYAECNGFNRPAAADSKFENVEEGNDHSLNSKKKDMEAENRLSLLPLVNASENNIAANMEAGYTYISAKGSEDDNKFSLDRFDECCLQDKEAGNCTVRGLTGKDYNCHPCSDCARGHVEVIEIAYGDSGIDMEKMDQPLEGNSQPGTKKDFSGLEANEDLSCNRGGLSVENDAGTSLVIKQLRENRGALEGVDANNGIGCQDLSDILGSENNTINTKDNQEEESALHSLHHVINSFEESMEEKSICPRNGKIGDQSTKDSEVCVQEDQAFMEVDASMQSEPVLQDPANDKGSQPGECQSNHRNMPFYGSSSLTRSSNPVFKIDFKDPDSKKIVAQRFLELDVNMPAERVLQNPFHDDHLSDSRDFNLAEPKGPKLEVYESNHNDMDFCGSISIANCFIPTCQADYKEDKCGRDDTSGRDENETAGKHITVEEESMPEKSRSPGNGTIDDQSAKYNEVWVQDNQAFLEMDVRMPTEPGRQDPSDDNGLRDYGSQPGECQSNHRAFNRSNSPTRSFNPPFGIDFKGASSVRIDDQSAHYNNTPGVLQDPFHEDHLIESSDDKLGPDCPKREIDESIHNDTDFCGSMSTSSCFSITPTYQADFNDEGIPRNESSDQKDHDGLTYATDGLNLENNAFFAVFEDVSLVNIIDCKVSNQPSCTNGSESNSSQIKEAALGSALPDHMPLASSDSKEAKVFDVLLVSPLKEIKNSKLSVPSSFVGGDLDIFENLYVSSKVDLENKKCKKYLEIKENLTTPRWSVSQVSEMQLSESKHHTDPAILKAPISGDEKNSNEEKGMFTMLLEHRDQVTEMHESIMVDTVHELRTSDYVDINVSNYAAAQDAEVDGNWPANVNKFESAECSDHSMTNKRTEMESENRWWPMLPLGMLELKDGVDIFKASTVSDTFEGTETQNEAAQTASLVEMKSADLNNSSDVSSDLDKSEFVVLDDALAKDGETKSKEIIEEVVNHFDEGNKEMVDGVSEYGDNKELVSNDNCVASVKAWDNNVPASDQSGCKTTEEKSLQNVKDGEENYATDNSIGKAITGENYECHLYSNFVRDNVEAMEMDNEDTGIAHEKFDQSFEANNVFGKMEAVSDQEVNEGVTDAADVFTVENDAENSLVIKQPHVNSIVLEEVNCPDLNKTFCIYNLELNDELGKYEGISYQEVNEGLTDDFRDGFSVEKDSQSSFDPNNIHGNRNLSEVLCPDLNIISSSYNSQTNTKDTSKEVASHNLENMTIFSPKSKHLIDFEGLSIPKTELCNESSSYSHVTAPSSLETKALENDANLPLFTARELSMLLEDGRGDNFQNSPDGTLEANLTTETDESQIIENITLVDEEQHDELGHRTLEEDDASSCHQICPSKGLDEKHDVSVIFQECLDCEYHKDESAPFVYSMGASETNISSLSSSNLPTLLCGSNDSKQMGSSLIPGDVKFSAKCCRNEDIKETTELSKDVLEPITTSVNQHSISTNSVIGSDVASEEEDKLYQLKLEPHQDKSEGTYLLGSINESSFMKRRNVERLIPRTPMKLQKVSDMKENDLGTKREQIDTTTAKKASQKRQPLSDLHKN